jgi:hypothetical protein
MRAQLLSRMLTSRQSYILHHRRNPSLATSALYPTYPTSLARKDRNLPAHGPWPPLRRCHYTQNCPT